MGTRVTEGGVWDMRRVAGSSAPAGSVPRVSDDDILSLWRTVRPSRDQNKAMTYVEWKDGIDCYYPTHELRRLVELAMADGFKMAQNSEHHARPERSERT